MEEQINAVIRRIEPALSSLLDTRNLYVALCDHDHAGIQFVFAKQNGKDVALGTDDCPEVYRDRPFGSGLTEYVICRDEPLLIEADFDRHVQGLHISAFSIGTKCWLGAPLKVGRDVLGVIGLQNFEAERVFDESHRRVLATVASQAAVAVANARLYQNLKRKSWDIEHANQELQVLSGIYEQIIQQGIASVDNLLDLIYSETKRIFAMSKVMEDVLFFIALYDEKVDEVSFGLVIEQDKGNKIDEIRWGRRNTEIVPQWSSRKSAFSPRLTEYVMRAKKPVLIPDRFSEWVADVGIRRWPGIGLRERQTLSWLGVPMIVGQRIIGVISIQSFEEERAFDKTHADLLFRVAGQTGVAIENARLYAKLSDAYEALQRARESELMAVLGEMTVGLIHKMANTIGPIPSLVDRIGHNITDADLLDSAVHAKLRYIKDGASDALLFIGEMSYIQQLQKINKEPVDLKIPVDGAIQRALPDPGGRGSDSGLATLPRPLSLIAMLRS